VGAASASHAWRTRQRSANSDDFAVAEGARFTGAPGGNSVTIYFGADRPGIGRIGLGEGCDQDETALRSILNSTGAAGFVEVSASNI